MSAPLAGKFQDHYTILGVDPKANSDAIQAAYAKLAQKFHKDNPETGDPAKFESVNLAYEVLCDATLRAEFDKVKGIDQDDDKPQFMGVEFFGLLGRQTGLRAALLSVMYDRRQKKPYRPAMSMRHLDGMLAATIDELSFTLWYLKQRGLVQSDDKSNLQITVQGMDFLEGLRPEPELVLPYLKPGAIAVPPTAVLPTNPVQPPVVQLANAIQSAGTGKAVRAEKPAARAAEERESVTKVMTRALARR